ncbi:MAG TPA: TetR/AcrR family transcriptional regulator C-terminal domain-containing protein [Micromonosporaceae bacterium]|nr:TetR/AcrR family transcriptional regulator C-terminal domain-containing protein [Micromonosporaceae bacterium]
MVSAYLGIANDLSDRIRDGELRAGDRVPSTRQISAQWGVAIATATKALAELQRRGLVRAVAGVGTVVAQASVGPEGTSASLSGNGGGSATRPASGLDAATSGSRGATRSLRTPTARRDGGDMRDRIVETAVRLADAEGIAAVSMRRIGVELGMPTMSLYRWMPSKDDLTTHMLDVTLGRIDWPQAPPKGWRAQLELVARAQWAITREHPWLAQLLSMTRPQLAPNAMMHTEWSMRALSGLGLSGGEALRISLTLVSFGIGTALAVDNELQAQRDTGMTSDEWMDRQEAQARAIFATGRYPFLAHFAESEDFDSELDVLFETGLGVILDGVERLLEKKAAERPAREAKRRAASSNRSRSGGAAAAR